MPQVGPNALLKVMAGDVVNATTDYYYQAPVTNTSGTTTLTQNIITSIISAITGGTAATDNVKQGSAGIGTALQPGSNAPFLDVTQPDQTAGSTLPKAYLTVLFFDERFNYVGTTEATPYKRVSQSGDNASPLVLANLRAPKNGYAYIYLSNESAEPVYFDNFKVALNRARIIEEDHYYAFGLKIAAISSQKVGDVNEGYLDNKNLYNDKELFDDGDLDWYDYGFRNYDAQIGRFTQLDPLTWGYPELTNYQYAGNEPIANVDMDGLEPAPINFAISIAENFYTGATTSLTDVVITTAVKQSAKTIGTNVLTNVISLTSKVPSLINIEQSTVKAYSPNVFEKWSKSESFVGKLTYNLVDDIYVAAQTFRDKANKQHLGGGHVNNNESVKAGISTLTYLAPIGVEANATEKGLNILEKGVQISEDVILKEGRQATEEVLEGGLNLYKFNSDEAIYKQWKPGDRFLRLTETDPKLAWKQNKSLLLDEIKKGKPIFDSYINPDGTLRETGGFLQRERNLLLRKKWTFNQKIGAWTPR